MAIYSNSNETEFQNNKKAFIKKVFIATAILSFLSMLFSLICDAILSTSNVDTLAYLRYFSVVYIPIVFMLPNIFLNKNMKQESCMLSTSQTLAMLRIPKEEREQTIKKSISNNTDKWYRAKSYPLYIITFVWCFFGIFIALSYFSKDIKFYFTTNFSTGAVFLTFSGLSALTMIIAFCIFIHYLSAWKKTLIWNYDEFNLSLSKQEDILKTEREEYAQIKKKNAQLRSEVKSKNKETKIKNEHISTYYKKSPNYMTKLSKLNELK